MQFRCQILFFCGDVLVYQFVINIQVKVFVHGQVIGLLGVGYFVLYFWEEKQLIVNFVSMHILTCNFGFDHIILQAKI